MEPKKHILLLSILLPFFIIGGIFYRAVYPLKFGKPVLLAVYPVDPRDLLRGQYVDLNYDFSEMHLNKIKTSLPAGKEFHYGDTFYIELIINKDSGLAQTVSLKTEKPEDGLFLKVTPAESFEVPKKKNTFMSVEFLAGIESYFVPQEKAKQLEEMVNQKKLAARVFVDHNGDARIESLLEIPGN